MVYYSNIKVIHIQGVKLAKLAFQLYNHQHSQATEMKESLLGAHFFNANLLCI